MGMPRFFELDGKWALLTSPQDMLIDKGEYHSGNGTLCLIGDYNLEDGRFTEETNHSIDSWPGFYATQTLLAPDRGGELWVGWMQNWDSVSPSDAGCQMVRADEPSRELSVKDGRLIRSRSAKSRHFGRLSGRKAAQSGY